MNSELSYKRICFGLYAFIFGTLGWVYTPYFGWTLLVSLFFGLLLTGGLHMYFAHRSYELGRKRQFLLALLCVLSGQDNPLAWATFHRRHHLYSDTDHDPHSPVRKSLFESLVIWTFFRENVEVRLEEIPDWAKFPELVWLAKFHDHVYTSFLVGLHLILISVFYFHYGLSVPSAMYWTQVNVNIWYLAPFLHTTIASALVNVIDHKFGYRKYPTNDNSRNELFTGIYCLGIGWHNNHHAYPQFINCGQKWWQFDFTYYTIWMLHKLRIVKSMNVFKAKNQ